MPSSGSGGLSTKRRAAVQISNNWLMIRCSHFLLLNWNCKSSSRGEGRKTKNTESSLKSARRERSISFFFFWAIPRKRRRFDLDQSGLQLGWNPIPHQKDYLEESGSEDGPCSHSGYFASYTARRLTSNKDTLLKCWMGGIDLLQIRAEEAQIARQGPHFSSLEAFLWAPDQCMGNPWP